jgi:hypothetical protein
LPEKILLSALRHKDALVQVHAFKIVANLSKLNESLLASARKL